MSTLGEIDGSKICLDCGVTWENSMSDRDLWRQRPDRKFKYRDAHGTYYASKEPMPCPFFIGALDIAVGDGMLADKRAKERMQDFEEDIGIFAERLRALEDENLALKAQLAAAPQVTVEAVLAALADMAAARKAPEPAILTDGGVVHDPILDLVWDEKQAVFAMPEDEK